MLGGSGGNGYRDRRLFRLSKSIDLSVSDVALDVEEDELATATVESSLASSNTTSPTNNKKQSKNTKKHKQSRNQRKKAKRTAVPFNRQDIPEWIDERVVAQTKDFQAFYAVHPIGFNRHGVDCWYDHQQKKYIYSLCGPFSGAFTFHSSTPAAPPGRPRTFMEESVRWLLRHGVDLDDTYVAFDEDDEDDWAEATARLEKNRPQLYNEDYTVAIQYVAGEHRLDAIYEALQTVAVVHTEEQIYYATALPNDLLDLINSYQPITCLQLVQEIVEGWQKLAQGSWLNCQRLYCAHILTSVQQIDSALRKDGAKTSWSISKKIPGKHGLVSSYQHFRASEFVRTGVVQWKAMVDGPLISTPENKLNFAKEEELLAAQPPPRRRELTFYVDRVNCTTLHVLKYGFVLATKNPVLELDMTSVIYRK